MSYDKCFFRPRGGYGAQEESVKKDLLSHEETCALARRARLGDVSARNRLVECNMGLAIDEASRGKYRNSGLPLDDLMSEAVLGLIKASERFDPDMGWKFSTYAVPCIRQAIFDALSEKTRDFKVSRDMVSKARAAREAFDSTDSSKSSARRLSEAARIAGCSERKLSERLSFSPYAESLDGMAEDGGPGAAQGFCRDERTATPEEELVRKMDVQALRVALSGLRAFDERMFYVITEHSGIFSRDGAGKPFSEIAKAIGLSKQQACNIEKRAREFVRTRLSA